MPDPAEYDEREAIHAHLHSFLSSYRRTKAERFFFRWTRGHADPGAFLDDFRFNWLCRSEGLEDDPEIVLLKQEGYSHFMDRVASEVLGGLRGPFELNRCPKCARLPRTPLAKQCPWCYHR